MTQVHYIQETRRDDILADAVSKKTQLNLTRKGGDGWVVAKSRFVGHCSNPAGLLIELPANRDETAWPVLTVGEFIGVAFRRGHKKCLFSAPVIQTQTPVEGRDKSRAFAVRWPEELQEMQRRVYQRAAPPPGRTIHVRIESEPACTGPLEDISAGGVRMRCSTKPDLRDGQSVRVAVALRAKKPEMVLDATFRHCQATADGAWSLGFQFVGLETTHQGQQQLVNLARVVTDFQRAHSRRRAAPLRSDRHAR